MEEDNAPHGWSLYFLGANYLDILDEKPFIPDVISIGYELLKHSGAFNDSTSFLDSTKAIEIDYDTLQDALSANGYGELLRDDPTTTIRTLGLAAYKVSKFGYFF